MTSTTLVRLWAGVTALALCGGLLLGPAPAGGIGKPERTRAILATVSIRPVNERGQALKDGACSGTVIGPEGLILTSFACVGRTAAVSKDPSRPRLRAGELYHPEGLVQVAPTRDERRAPLPAFSATLVAGDAAEDLAILKLVGGVRREEPLPRPLPIVINPLGDSDAVDPNDRMHTAGYPEVGGATVTFTSGAIAGFEDADRDGEADTFKYDARVGRGLSGGLVMDEQGAQIAVHTSLGEGGIGRGRMVNRALPFLAKAGGPARTGGASSTAGPPATRTVVVSGRIVDADTKRGIGQASLVVLRPGASLADWEARGDAVALLTAVTDGEGRFTTAPLPAGPSYTGVALAKGYQTRGVDALIATGGAAAGVVELDAVVLRKK